MWLIEDQKNFQKNFKKWELFQFFSHAGTVEENTWHFEVLLLFLSLRYGADLGRSRLVCMCKGMDIALVGIFGFRFLVYAYIDVSHCVICLTHFFEFLLQLLCSFVQFDLGLYCILFELTGGHFVRISKTSSPWLPAFTNPWPKMILIFLEIGCLSLLLCSYTWSPALSTKFTPFLFTRRYRHLIFPLGLFFWNLEVRILMCLVNQCQYWIYYFCVVHCASKLSWCLGLLESHVRPFTLNLPLPCSMVSIYILSWSVPLTHNLYNKYSLGDMSFLCDMCSILFNCWFRSVCGHVSVFVVR